MAEHIFGLRIDWTDLEDLALLSCPLQVSNKIWIIHKPAVLAEHVCHSEASDQLVVEDTEGSQSQDSGIYIEIGTITEVADEHITISMHSGGSTTLGHEVLQGEVDIHNDIVNHVIEEKKIAADNEAARHEPEFTEECTEKNKASAESTEDASASVIVGLPGPLHNLPPPPLQDLVMPIAICENR